MLRLVALLTCLALPARADTALVAVAANFAEAAQELARAFNADTGHEVQITTGSTGKLYAQIKAGAPFDMMLSADRATPQRLRDEDLGFALFPYAIGRLVFWAPKSPPEPEPSFTFDIMENARHIAIANPALAPYGQAARQALDGMDAWDSLQGKLVMGENIGQAYALVASGAAEAGFVAASSLPPDAPGYIWQVTPTLYAPIQQDGIILNHAEENGLAYAFRDFLATKAAAQIILRHGYGLPE